MGKGTWIAFGSAVALVLVGIMALLPLLSSRAKEPAIPLVREPLSISAHTPTLLPTSAPTPRATQSPSLSPSPSTEAASGQPGLTWERLALLDGQCSRLVVTDGSSVCYHPCGEGPRVAYLTRDELERYAALVQGSRSFTYAVQEEEGLGRIATVRVELSGTGAGSAAPAAQAKAAAWAAGVFERLMEAERCSDAIALARLDLTQRLGQPIEAVTLLGVEPVTWPDACLGIASEGLFCAQVETPGYRILLRVGDQTREYRADRHGLVRSASPPAQ